MDIRVLGPLEVEREGELLGLGGTKQRSVLAVLVLHAREVLGPDRLVDAVWDGAPPPGVEATLRAYVSNLRKALEPDRRRKDPPRVLRTTAAGYVLDVTDDQLDARRFEGLVGLGRDRRAAGDVVGAIECWTDALELWRGEAYQDFAYSDFARAESGRLEELRLACREDLFDARLECGHHDAVTGDLEAFCTAHPERERALRLWMLALYRCGRQSEALRVYEDGRRRLASEFGVDPSPELRAVHEQILRQDEVLVTPSEPSRKRTLTFLFGDVERSTERLRALGDDYPDVLDEHRRVFREACESHDGRAVRTYGDGTFAAFGCATDAVGAAVAVQAALSRTNLDEGHRLPLRMGVHTGEAVLSGGEYTGVSVHVAARVMDAAHGGQILVSQATKELFEAEEAAEVTFVDTGLHMLKDVPDVVRLFQVVHPELRRDFPPLRTRAGRTDNLPNRLTSFVGREGDLKEIVAELTGCRVVTVTGVGGVGKTRLAVEAGHRLVSRYPDGVWLCELASLGDADALVHSIATTLAVEQQPGLSMRDSLLAALRQRRSLVILDNCEHLLGPVAGLVEDIVRVSRDTDVLATSREALGVEGERSRPLRSLEIAADDATTGAPRLFVDRARAVRPDFSIGDRNTDDVVDICTRLDGIPLAVELAAARVTSMSPAQIAARLEEGFRFLRSGRRAAVDRHRTLHRAIDWSYDLLSEAERLLFDRLSVFAGGFTLEAAEEVCGPGLEVDVADGLASLVAKSMVDADVTGHEARYTLLETMRQYAQDRLAARGEAYDSLRAHATYFVKVLDALADLGLVESEGVMPRLVAEFDNVRAAHAWAASSGDADLSVRLVAGVDFPWFLSFPEVFRWADGAVAIPGAEEHRLLPVVLAVAAYGAAAGGDLAGANDHTDRALHLVDDPDDARRLLALGVLGVVLLWEGRLDDARRWIAEMLRVARASDNVRYQAMANSGGSMVESMAGDHATAVEMAESGYALARTGSSAMQAHALYYFGEALLAAGEFERALDCLDRSIELCRANQMPFFVNVALVAVASLRARHGDPLQALPMLGDVIDRWRRLADWPRQWVTLLNLVELLARLGVHEAAAVLLAASEASATAPPMFGPQAERLAELRRTLAERMGAKAYATAGERGPAMSDEDAVAYAKAEIDRALVAGAGP